MVPMLTVDTLRPILTAGLGWSVDDVGAYLVALQSRNLLPVGIRKLRPQLIQRDLPRLCRGESAEEMPRKQGSCIRHEKT